MDVLRIVYSWRRHEKSEEIGKEKKVEKVWRHMGEKEMAEEVREETMEKKNEEDDGYTSGEYTSEDDGYVWPNGTRRRTREEWAKYHKQVEESEGFDVDLFPGTREHGFIALTNFDETVIECTKAAIEHFNKENDASFRFVKIEKTTSLVVAGLWYHITFQAIDGEANLKTFQAKTFYGIDHSIAVVLCRFKPTAS